MEPVASKDELLRKAMWEELTMLGEIRVRAEEEKSTRASREVTAIFHPTQYPSANAMVASPAPKGK
eukprot:12842514-Prorocentrum_lima.AAC.1